MNSNTQHIGQVPDVDMKAKVYKVLKTVNYPGRYIGTEIGSFNKNFNTAKVKTVLAFPDLYEIGISNFGIKVLYNRINMSPGLMCDRVYAPDKDFLEVLKKEEIPLYGVESFVPLKKFDMVAFSLQYELNYTTMLGMLEVAGISLVTKDRSIDDPLIVVGGPSTYNPEPFADFVDIVCIGDGEDIILDLINAYNTKKEQGYSSRIELLLELSKIKGAYIPSLYTLDENGCHTPINASIPQKIMRRINHLKPEEHPTESPIPYLKAVHDRSIIEIRRGCGRMCRFCQPCFVNLPVRERSPQEVEELCFGSLEKSGYDEYSLLSLSTCDYQGIEKLAISLNRDLSGKNISLSLPSQRADNFNIDLAREIQSVRKSTLTFAPEAGTDRLRRVINKNLTQDQIINTALNAYKAGWKKVKFYFIIGLPTETEEDLDGIIKLLLDIKEESFQLKKQCPEIKHPLDIICTVSLLVNKPFTPFQWFGQQTQEEIRAKIKYLSAKAKSIKGIKLNFHDLYTSKLEALFARGNRSLSTYILEAYKSGAYLDSWTEHFSRQIWDDAQATVGINVEEIIQKDFELEEYLPWNIIEPGVDKQWLIKEKNLALEALNSVPCEESCSNCGVCPTLEVKPDYRSRNAKDIEITKSLEANVSKVEKYRYRIKLTKEDSLRFISHLDWFRTMYRALRKANIPIGFSQGFNPSPKMSIGVPLGIFIESVSEYMDVELTTYMLPDLIKNNLNSFLPDQCKILEVKQIDLKSESLSKTAYWGDYEACFESSIEKLESLEADIQQILSQETIMVQKKTKKGLKELNIKSLLNNVKIHSSPDWKLQFTLCIAQESTVKPELFLALFSNPADWKIKRIKLMDKEFKSL